MKTRFFVLLPLLLTGLAFLPAGCDSTPESPKGENDHAAAREEAASVYAYGIVEARRHSTLSAKFPGKIEKILVREGEKVRQGQLLARFEARELEAMAGVAKAQVGVTVAMLAEAEAGVRTPEITAGQERLRDAEAQLGKALADQLRYQQLRDSGAVSEAEWEGFRLREETAMARRNEAAQQLRLLEEGTRAEAIAVLKKRLELARAEVERANAALANAEMTAPYDGVITRRHREEGEALDIGLPVLDIATLDDRYVRAEIDETDIGRIAEGQATLVTADGFPNLRFDGRLVAVKQQMGAKRLIPTDPSKIVDYKVLDVEVSLPADCPFPVKLPVNVRISLR